MFWEKVAIIKRRQGRRGEVAEGSKRAGSELKLIELRVEAKVAKRRADRGVI